MKENQAQFEIQQMLGITSLWRNNVGAVTFKDPRTKTNRHVKFGLGNTGRLNTVFKSSDLIGIDQYGRFFAREVKPSDWKFQRSKDPKNPTRDEAQYNFIRHINKKGGNAAFWILGRGSWLPKGLEMNWEKIAHLWGVDIKIYGDDEGVYVDSHDFVEWLCTSRGPDMSSVSKKFNADKIQLLLLADCVSMLATESFEGPARDLMQAIESARNSKT